MKTNTAARMSYATTHEGGRAVARQSPLLELRRAVSTCLLWEDTFYEKGSDIAARIADLCTKVSAEDLSALAIQARTDLKLRHVPLFLVRQMAKLHTGAIVGHTLASVVQRPDEAGEFLALYWKDKRQPLSAQVKKGLAKAMTKFSAYQVSKWDREAQVKLKDVLFLTHAKPKDAVQAETWKALIDGTLASADTWEVALSAGADKKATWERLLTERKLGYMALLQNLRNMGQAKVDSGLIEAALKAGAKGSKALPFRFVAAARFAPDFAQMVSEAMVLALESTEPLPGHTALVVDVSGSMTGRISGKSKLDRRDAAGALAVLLREICERASVYTFADSLESVPNFRGLPLVDAIRHAGGGGTNLEASLRTLKAKQPTLDRIIVITDEQAHDGILPCWATHGYVVNVAGYQPALDVRHGWTRISGWSERLVDWLRLEEAEPALTAEE